MPFIHIKSLPFDKPFNVNTTIEKLSKEFSRVNNIDLKHITVTWEFFTPNHYALAGKTAKYQANDSHPIIVDFLTADFNSMQVIEKMLNTIATSISNLSDISINNIFINHRQAISGMVFDEGKIARW